MTFNSEEQLAGFTSVDFYLLEETAGWPEVLTDITAAGVLLTPEDVEVDGSIVPESISVNDVPANGDQGDLWPISITFTYKYRGAAMEQLLEQYANKPGVALTCLNDGTRKMYGTNEEPIYLQWGNAYGQKMEDQNGVAITLKGTQSQRPVFYNPA